MEIHDLTDDLLTYFPGAIPDNRGNYWAACPSCQRHPARAKKFSFNVEKSVFNCFTCGYSGSARSLLEKVSGKTVSGDWTPPPKAPPPPPRRWQTDPDRFIKAFLGHPDRIGLWQAYRPLTLETIARWRLGVGRLPNVKCDHLRLTYPATKSGKVVGLRGRALDCECPKWLSSAGSVATLMGYARRGKPLIICESPVDAFLVLQEIPDVGAIAGTAGVNTWKDEWTEFVHQVEPEFVVVVFDNDLAGAATGAFREGLVKEWKGKRKPGARPPQENAAKVARKLRLTGLSVNVARWPLGTPEGQDIGAMAMEGR